MRRLTAVAAWLLLAAPPPAAARPAAVFANGKGVSVPGAVWGKRAGGPASPSIYQLQPERWSPAMLQRLRASGFGFIRLVTTPVPLMTDDRAALDRALAWVASLVDQANAAGLAVIVDLHFWSTDAPLSQDTMAPDPLQRAALLRAEEAIARNLAAKAGRRVALELLNEPACSNVSGPAVWAAFQQVIFARVRRVAPRLPLVLTACRSRYDKLTIFDARPYRRDPNVYWTFHFYDPLVFVSQEDLRLRSVPFPPRPSLANSIPAMQAMLPISAVTSRPHTLLDLRTYLLTNHGRATIAAQMDGVTAWARRSGIAPERIYLGEFAPLLSASPANEAIRPDQLRWIGAARSEAERRGFAWAYWGVPERGNLNYDPRTRFFRADTLAALGLAPDRAMASPR